MDLGLKGKRALVTASSKGLGFATARELVREGARVMINSHDQGNLDAAIGRLREEFGDRTQINALAANLSEETGVSALVEGAAETLGGLDIVVTNNAGPPAGTFATTSVDAWRDGLELTLMSVVNLLQAALPQLERSDAASVLTVTSVAVKQPVPGLHLSNVIRPAVAGLTKALAQEFGPSGVRANSILPGWTATERVQYILAQRAEANGTTAEEEAAAITAGIPLGRMADPAEFGRVAAFLVSPAASYLDGVMLQVDGGAYGGLL